MKNKFIILALPRSRTAWLSELFSFDGIECGHDLAVECASIRDFELSLDDVDGTVETGAVLGWRVLLDRMPSLRLAVVHRPVNEVHASLAKHGWDVDWEELEMRSTMLRGLGQVPGVYSTEFDELATYAGCGRLYSHCTDLTLDYDRWLALKDMNIQIDLARRAQRLRANASRLEGLRSELAMETKKLGAPQWATWN